MKNNKWKKIEVKEYTKKNMPNYVKDSGVGGVVMRQKGENSIILLTSKISHLVSHPENKDILVCVKIPNPPTLLELLELYFAIKSKEAEEVFNNSPLPPLPPFPIKEDGGKK